MKFYLLTFCCLWALALGDEQEVKLPKPDIYSLRVESTIKNRYAQTKVTSNIANRANASQEVFFTMTLPQDAFITSFLMEIKGQEYKAYLKEKEKAKEDYDAAVASGITAAHVEQIKRDSNIFTISVNVEAQGKVKFILRYEELLSRALGMYTHVINLNPRQAVKDLQVDVYISEPSNITMLFIPALRTTNEILDEEKENEVVTTNKTDNRVHVQYKPTLAEQEKLSEHEYGGQLVVQYDVDRGVNAGNQILVNDGYFVHFFSPENLAPMRKYAIFVLDLSGSMDGRKLEQLKEAMKTILEDLKPEDYFNIVDFSYAVTVHNLAVPAHSAVLSPEEGMPYYYASRPNEKIETYAVPDAYPATKENLEKAKQIINKMNADGGTNIYDALKHSIAIAKTGLAGIKKQENITDESKPIQPIIVFLTDGEPTVGVTSSSKIISMVNELNRPKTSIFSLGFGSGADMPFLRKVSLSSSAFARTIYEAADATIQLKNFYKEISSPLLSNVTFEYVPGQVKNRTKEFFPTFFLGSEIVVAGKVDSDDFDPNVNALTSTGMQNFTAHINKYFYPHSPPSGDEEIDPKDSPLTPKKKEKKTQNNLERVWAFMTLKQLLDQHDAIEPDDNSTKKEDIKKSAIELAMKYQFVTPFTSLIVVKPNETKEATLEPTDERPNYLSGGVGFAAPSSFAIRIPPASSPNFGGFGGASPVLKMQASYPSLLTPRFGGGSGRPGQPLSAWSGPQSYPAPAMFVTTTADALYAASESAMSEDKADPVSGLDELNIKLTWFNSSYTEDNNTLTLPTGANATNEHFSVAQQRDGTQFQDCSVLGMNGKCEHLIDCITMDIASSLDDYLQYFCPIVGGFAGVCCKQTMPTPPVGGAQP